MKGKVLVPHDFHGYVLDWIDGNAVWGELDLFLWQGRFRVSLSLVIPNIVPTNHRMSQIWEMFDSSSKSFCWKTNWVSLSDQQSQHWIEMSLSFGCHQFRSWISKPYSFGNRNKVHFDLHFPEKPKWEHDWEPNGDVPFKSCYLYVHKYIWCICTYTYIYIRRHISKDIYDWRYIKKNNCPLCAIIPHFGVSKRHQHPIPHLPNIETHHLVNS